MKNKNSFWIDRWNYSVADVPTVLDEKIVLISIACFGPLEIDELGLDEQSPMNFIDGAKMIYMKMKTTAGIFRWKN